MAKRSRLGGSRKQGQTSLLARHVGWVEDAMQKAAGRGAGEIPRDFEGLVEYLHDSVFRVDLLAKEELTDEELDELIALAGEGRFVSFDSDLPAKVIRAAISKRLFEGDPLSRPVRATILGGFLSLDTPELLDSFFLHAPKRASRGRPKGSGRKITLIDALIAYGLARDHIRPAGKALRGESDQSALASQLGLSVRDLQRLKSEALKAIAATKN